MVDRWTADAQRDASRRETSRGSIRSQRLLAYTPVPWHFLNFLPEPHGHGSLRPTFDQSPLAPAPPVGDAAGLMDLVRPAPTTIGSVRAAAFFFGGSAGPTSITSASAAGAGGSSTVPLPFADDPSSSGMSSRMPSALYRLVGFRGPSGPRPRCPAPS